jgi:hypothetical protein
MVTFLASVTGCVVIVNVARLSPGGMVTESGTEASAGFVLPKATFAPPGPAVQPWSRLTVPVTVVPPSGVVVLTVKPLSWIVGSG